jgi:hypothetical protein
MKKAIISTKRKHCARKELGFGGLLYQTLSNICTAPEI